MIVIEVHDYKHVSEFIKNALSYVVKHKLNRGLRSDKEVTHCRC